MEVTGVTPILNVSSLKQSFEWFEKLGWRKVFDWGDPPTFGAVISGKSEIFLCQGCQGARGGPPHREAWDNQAGSTWMSWFLATPAEVDAFYDRALELGIPAPFPPTDMPWSVRECHIRHPDGHTIRVGAGLPEEPE
jgi:catechol 2,3-dioxygenase-like lactoylglutathione lyase family enzyme